MSDHGCCNQCGLLFDKCKCLSYGTTRLGADAVIKPSSSATMQNIIADNEVIMGYHKKKINKGTLGEFSKIREEWEELCDAHDQDGKVLEICELADLYGAISLYIKNKYGLTMEDIKMMSDMTTAAFKNGKRS